MKLPSQDFTSPQSIAAALEAVAQRLRALPDTTITATRVNLNVIVDGYNMQACQTADLLATAIIGNGSAHLENSRGVTYSRRQPNGLSASVSAQHRGTAQTGAATFDTVIQVSDSSSTNIITGRDLHL